MSTQTQRVLPRTAWSNIVIEENNEKMVEVYETSKLRLSTRFHSSYTPSFFVRETVLHKLIQAANNLPDGFSLILIEGYRSLETQQQSWDANILFVQQENPTWSQEEIENVVKLVSARPTPLANHHCGGAVDVLLGDNKGNILDCGSIYPSGTCTAKMRKRFPMFSEYINTAQAYNRKILREAMGTAGFVWYPGEWWHYCWGDRMWAVYTDQKKCLYGPVDLPK